jgi:hypothetical protein
MSSENGKNEITLGELQAIIGAKEIEMFRLRATAEEFIAKLQSENKALREEVSRLKGPNVVMAETFPNEPEQLSLPL